MSWFREASAHPFAASSRGGGLHKQQLRFQSKLVDAQEVGERKDRCAVRRPAVLLFVAALFAASNYAALPAAASMSTRHMTPKSVSRHISHPVIRIAPADEYFGRLKMSILGIRNQLHDLELRLQFAPDKSEDVLGSAATVEDAMRDWEHKYPADPWLPKSVYELTSLYANVHTPHGYSNATRCLRWLLGRYGRTRYGTIARGQIKPSVGLR
jgi:hypothetical protein